MVSPSARRSQGQGAGRRALSARVRGREFTSPILMACLNGDGKVIELLIRAGVDVNAKSGWGRTMLALAARDGHLDAVESADTVIVPNRPDIEHPPHPAVGGR